MGKPRKGRKPDHEGGTRAVEGDRVFFSQRIRSIGRRPSFLREESRPNKSSRETSNSSKAPRKSPDEAFSRSRLLYLRTRYSELTLYRHSAFYYLIQRKRSSSGKTKYVRSKIKSTNHIINVIFLRQLKHNHHSNCIKNSVDI